MSIKLVAIKCWFAPVKNVTVPSTAFLLVKLMKRVQVVLKLRMTSVYEMESHFIEQFTGLVDQGKAIKANSAPPVSYHFLQAGDYTLSCNWNFIHRALLSCLQINTTRRLVNRNPKCPKCGCS
ncbi:hypothetical protein NPIL_435861 [Nephila pilipes]|uniref:Uncharacterized protein n=1 Tax=Nephila pilipes TaxID=299642 RepID=A0A8X6QIE6_NEPPI|nr:hypothetical protein NPIL_435861 [Nephila pilipes]